MRLGNMSEAHKFSWQAWENRDVEGKNLPDVLCFEFRPDDFNAEGLYIGFADFEDLRLDYSKTVPLVSAYHALVYHLARPYPVIYEQARRELYNNQDNSRFGYTRNYLLLGSALLPYAHEPPGPGYKIDGIGKFGRELLRAVLHDDEYMPIEPTDLELFGQPASNSEEDIV